MKWPLFENKIKSELSAHRSEVDIDVLWSAIEPGVDAMNQSKHKKRFSIIWFLFAGVLLLGSGVGLYFLNNSETAVSKTVSDKIANNKINNGDETVINIPSNNAEIIIENIKETNPIIDNQTENNSNSNSSFNSNDNNSSKDNKKIASLVPPVAENSKIKNQKSAEGIFNKTMQIKVTNKKNDLEIPINEAITKNGATIIFGNTLEKENIILNTISRINTPPIPLFKTTKNIPKIKIPALKGVLAGNPKQPGMPDEKRHPMGKKEFKFSIAANGGISYANRSLSGIDSTENDLIKLRGRTEKQLETSHLGVKLNMRHKSGFELSSGLQYTRIVERFDYHENITTTDSIQGILYYAVNPNNDTIAVSGTVPHTTHTAIEKKYYNRYTMFDIPVLAGYFKENENWSYGAQAGVFANIFLNTEGQFLTDPKNSIDIKDLFKSSVGMSYYLGFSGGYKLGDQVEISASPYVRYFPKNFAKTGYPISQKYTLFGLDVRFRYWF